MLNKLTKKQTELMAVIRDKWVKPVYNSKPTNKAKARKLIKYLYKLSNLEQPEIVFANGLEDLSKKLMASVRASVRASVGASVRDSVWASVRASVGASVWDSVWDSVGASVWDSVGASVWDSVWASVGASVRDSVGDLTDFGWLSFYDFFTEIDILNNKQYKEYRDLVLDSMCCLTILLRGKCLVLTMPTILHDNYKLHSAVDMAMKWQDGSGLYFLHGVKLDEKLWKQIVGGKMAFKDCMDIDNVEQRMVALREMNPDKMLEGAKAEKISTSKYGYDLYKVREIFSEDAYFLKYKCPSTDRVYITGIDPEVASKNDATRCAEWMMGLKRGQIKYITQQT